MGQRWSILIGPTKRVIEEAEKLVEEEVVVPTLYDLLVEFGRGNLCAAMEPDN